MMQNSQKKICAICKAPSKYCCPSCSMRTCSLRCVKVHKVKFDCDGIRNKSSFIALKDFDRTDLLSDYRFLEDISRTVDNAGRSKKRFGYGYNYLPLNLYKLRNAATRRKTDLSLLPPVFTKRKRNTTYFRYCDKIIFWRIEWSFPEAGAMYVDERLSENYTINSCLDKYLVPESSEVEIQHSLGYYQSYGHKGVAVLLKKEDDPSNITRYYELEKNKSFRKNFFQKKIVEYPVLIVVPVHNLHMFELVQQDGEVISSSTSTNLLASTSCVG